MSYHNGKPLTIGQCIIIAIGLTIIVYAMLVIPLALAR